MLQALKNLEARTVRLPASQTAKAKTGSSAAPDVVVPASHATPPMPGNVKFDALPVLSPMPRTEVPAPAAAIESLNTVVTGLASLEIGGHDPFFPAVGSAAPVTINTQAVWSAVAPASASPTPVVQPLPASPTITDIERMAGRTLSDPVRSKPLRELVDRLRHDMQQTAAKTIALVGVTEGSSTHEAIILAASMLAQQRRGKVLIVDGDASRRSLSEALEYGRDSGLAELLRDGGLAVKSCRSTATENLSFLPNGSAASGEVLQSGRLGQICGELSQSFECVLIDGGRASDAGASALARAADATYLVVQLGTVETSEAQMALATLRAAGARVLGCIAV